MLGVAAHGNREVGRLQIVPLVCEEDFGEVILFARDFDVSFLTVVLSGLKTQFFTGSLGGAPAKESVLLMQCFAVFYLVLIRVPVPFMVNFNDAIL